MRGLDILGLLHCGEKRCSASVQVPVKLTVDTGSWRIEPEVDGEWPNGWVDHWQSWKGARCPLHPPPPAPKAGR
jgi:hypothetical protein